MLPVEGALRLYSPTSEPNRPDRTFDLVVRVYRQGLVSTWLDRVPLGGHVPMIWPWPAPLTPDRRNAGARVGLVAFGVGITELYRVAASELRDQGVEEVVLLYATRLAEEQRVLREELQELLALHGPRFRLVGAVSRGSDPLYLRGRVDATMLSQVFPWADERRDNVRFLTSGTREMMDSAMASLESLGYDRETYKLIRDARLSSVFRGMLR